STDYPSLSAVLENVLNASPYMEQFVFEALFLIGKQEAAITRFKSRYGSMIRNQESSTVWEGWQMPRENKLPKTANHGWSGAALFLFPKWIHGINSVTSGFSKFTVQPFYGKLRSSTTTVPSSEGIISSSFTRTEKIINHTIKVPEKTTCQLILPSQYVDLAINGAYYKEKNKLTALGNSQIQFSKDSTKYSIALGAGTWNIQLLMSDSEYLQLTSTTLYSDGKALVFYPNPISASIFIDGNFTQKNVRIFSLEGKVLLKTTINANNNYINVSAIPKGMYILQLEEQSTGKKQSGKFLKL
ncbi:MAG: T9SS type A sorting domain-containing protein, partial [Sediminibacterium sp.]|nr:T9SS type A sorting domain-containing protein [Sediminibacterium sp.]